jgi:hypothetical protein
MSRILITGMSAPQTSESANKRTLSFAGLLKEALTESGHQVLMLEPDITWEKENLDYYDAVLVGVSPLTSLSANYAYGALHIIDLLKASDKLILFVDAPNPSQIKSGLTAIDSWGDNLTKDFYKNRKGYSLAVKKSGKLLDVVSFLLNDTWPTTIYPRLPWDKERSISSQLPDGASHRLAGINLDSFVVRKNTEGATDRTARWVADNPDSPWTRKKLSTLNYPAMPMKWNKGWTDVQVEQQIAQSIGALITPHKETTWWTYRYVQALNTGTPVSSLWLHTSEIGHAWSYLASTIEDMNPNERYNLSKAQATAYTANIPTKEEAMTKLQKTLGISKGVVNVV